MRDAEAMYVLQGVQQRHGHILHRKRRHWARDPDHAVVKAIMALLAPVTSSLIPFTTCGCPATIGECQTPSAALRSSPSRSQPSRQPCCRPCWRRHSPLPLMPLMPLTARAGVARPSPAEREARPVRGLIGSRARADGLRLPPPVCLRKHGRRRGCKYLNQSGRRW